MKFLGTNANVIAPPSDNQHTLGWTIRDNSVVEVYQDNPVNEPVGFSFKRIKTGYNFDGISCSPSGSFRLQDTRM